MCIHLSVNKMLNYWHAVIRLRHLILVFSFYKYNNLTMKVVQEVGKTKICDWGLVRYIKI